MFFRLLLLFTLIPLVEVWLLFKLSGALGWLATIALVLGTGIVGAWLARLQGFLALRAVQSELVRGKLPASTVVDGVLILIAGVLLITPGVLTDCAGLLLLVPPLRRLVRKGATAWLTKRVSITTSGLWAENHSPAGASQPSSRPRGEVIDARVVETRVED